MLPSGTYHRNVYFPPELNHALYFDSALQYSFHALKKLEQRGVVAPPTHLTLTPDSRGEQGEVFEVHVEHGVPQRFGVRLPYDEHEDLILIVSYGGTVVTMWLDHRRKSKSFTPSTNRYVRVPVTRWNHRLDRVPA